MGLSTSGSESIKLASSGRCGWCWLFCWCCWSSSKCCEYLGERGLVERPRAGDPLRAVDEAIRALVGGGGGRAGGRDGDEQTQ